MYDLICVGTGPASIFACVELVRNGFKNILMLEQGILRPDEPGISLTTGWSGAGGRSDGKLNHHHAVGTSTLPDIVGLKEYYDYLDRQEQIWLDFAPTQEQINTRLKQNPNADTTISKFTPNDLANKLRAKSLANNIELSTYPIRHLGSDNAFHITLNLFNYLADNGIEIKFNSKVESVKSDHQGAYDIKVGDNIYKGKNVMIGVGRSGSASFVKFMQDLDIPVKHGATDLGVRVEVPDEICSKLLKAGIYEPKFLYRSKTTDDACRTFCWNPSGFVVGETYPHTGLTTANGHSLEHTKSGNSNFAILVSKTFTAPFNDPIAYVESVCKLANLLSGGGLLVQRFGDLKAGRRSTHQRIAEGSMIPTCEATPGDLSLVLPGRQLQAIIEMIEAMDGVLPGMASKYTLFYGLEAKFYSNNVQINEFAEVHPGVYVGGDCSGHSRGLNAASVMGLMAAKGILQSVAKARF
jgi:uncharacterized FAD-dependent dehydrogenase